MPAITMAASKAKKSTRGSTPKAHAKQSAAKKPQPVKTAVSSARAAAQATAKASKKKAPSAASATQRVAKAKPAATQLKTAAMKRVSGKATKTYTQRDDFGAPVEGFFEKQPSELRAVLEELRKLVLEAAPDATASLKWGMPVYAVGGRTMCALGGHKAHVNLILTGPPSTFSDPAGRLAGEGKTARRLMLTSVKELPRTEVRSWLRAAARLARAGG